MFNGIVKSDDVEVIEFNNNNVLNDIYLSENCKNNILFISLTGSLISVSLSNTAYIGKVINITSLYGINATGKGISNGTISIKHSNTTLFTLKQGTVSFMYVGQQLNGLTATDKSKSGWIILGGVQGDTAITGYAGSIAIGSGAYCVADNAIAVGKSATASTSSASFGYSATTTANGVSVGYGTNATANGVSVGYAANSTNFGTCLGENTSAIYLYSAALGTKSYPYSSRIALKSNVQFSASGDAQAGKFILMRQTTDATPLVMSATNAAASTSNILILPNNGTYAFKGIVVAKDATTLDSAMWEVTALMRRGANASTTVLVGTPTIAKVFNDAGAAAWTIALTADTTNGGGTITVTGEAAKTIRWVCNIDSAELI